MSDGVLAGCRVLLAEDEYYLASDAIRALSQAGATIIGPFGALTQLQDQVEQDGFDVAALDIRLGGDLVYSAADLIRRMGLPIVFLTGYDESAIPQRFADVPLCQKPCPDEILITTIQALCAGP